MCCCGCAIALAQAIAEAESEAKTGARKARPTLAHDLDQSTPTAAALDSIEPVSRLRSLATHWRRRIGSTRLEGFKR